MISAPSAPFWKRKMTDYTELISRLRNMLHNETVKHKFYAIADASDALEAQERRIEELKEQLRTANNDFFNIEATEFDMKSRIAELEAALEPFAEVAERYGYLLPHSGMPAVAEDDVVMFELMYFHQARKVLGEKE